MNVIDINEIHKKYSSNRDVISLFSGGMGLDIGLEMAGLNVVIGQDFEPACVQTMQANGHNVLSGDIRQIEAQQLLDLTGLKKGEPFLICGGPPCQPFSTAGKRLGINDPRGSLFMDFIRMIDYIRPRFFVMENVKGIMSSPLKHTSLEERDESDPEQKLGSVLDVILSEFNKLGYKTVYGILDAVNYGVSQFRERFIHIIPEGGNWKNLPDELKPIAIAASGGNKALAEGIDIMIQNNETNTISAIAVKSGPSVFNADSKKRQEQNFMAAIKVKPTYSPADAFTSKLVKKL